jgi:hypothetical protein
MAKSQSGRKRQRTGALQDASRFSGTFKICPTSLLVAKLTLLYRNLQILMPLGFFHNDMKLLYINGL